MNFFCTAPDGDLYLQRAFKICYAYIDFLGFEGKVGDNAQYAGIALICFDYKTLIFVDVVISEDGFTRYLKFIQRKVGVAHLADQRLIGLQSIRHVAV